MVIQRFHWKNIGQMLKQNILKVWINVEKSTMK